MRIIFFFIVLALSGFSQAQFAIETEKATVSFVFVNDQTKGTLSDVKAQIKLDRSGLAGSSVSGSVAVSTLSTGNSARDKHLKSADFFDAKNYPAMKFKSSGITSEGGKYTASGTLTIKNVSKDVAFEIEEGANELFFKTVIYTLDFGIEVKGDREKTKVEVVVIVPFGE